MVLIPSYKPSEEMLFADETDIIHQSIEKLDLSEQERQQIAQTARALVEGVRAQQHRRGSLDAFLQEYALSSNEGVVLMCLAEALLRIPDRATANRLIADKLKGRNWQQHLGQSPSSFVNATSWGLLLTGRLVELGTNADQNLGGIFKKLISRSSEPIIRNAMKQAMRIMGKQFVLGRTIEEACDLAQPFKHQGYCFSYDMLGEAAFTRPDAQNYFEAYHHALMVLGHSSRGSTNGHDVFSQDSISIKLSALHPRYEEKQRQRVLSALLPKLLELSNLAKQFNLGLTIDAEEVHHLDLSLEIFGALAQAENLAGWSGLGLAVQAYSKRALSILYWLRSVAQHNNRRIAVRLVKGAYWDSEIKRAQEAGFESYPLFTRKTNTDINYLAAARYLLQNRGEFYPQFASHNAHSLAAVSVMAGPNRFFEFQRLHGMGQALYDQILPREKMNQPCRIYAPVGSHETLLGYLVRRLLENGANTSFVNRLADEKASIEEIIADPITVTQKLKTIPHPKIPLPKDIFLPRRNALGIPLWSEAHRQILMKKILDELKEKTHATPLINGKEVRGGEITILYSPHDRRVELGSICETQESDIEKALESAAIHQPQWDRLGGEARAIILEKAADLYEEKAPRLLALLVREAGKTLESAQAEWREAIDFLRYYAQGARAHFQNPISLPGPTGEQNELSLHGRGIFACIAPWNFPLAIFTGQIAAALAAGNAAVAKPAEQTPLIAFEAVKLLHQAGVVPQILQFLPGDGVKIGKSLLSHEKLSGVAFTGSNATAKHIDRQLSARDGAIPTLIAETGGMNAMIIDSSALIEQAVRDCLASAFDSAGQRCSAARIVFVQEESANRFLAMLTGAMAELKIGDPLNYETDIGPVIDEEAKQRLEDYKRLRAHDSTVLMDLKVPIDCAHGLYVAPSVYEIDALTLLEGEVFGPILHIVRFAQGHLTQVCKALNATGFGLTLGLHTRIEDTIKEVRNIVRVGNFYVNRNQIGAVVGSQPFGGEGLSGTGPKAGGPHYLYRFSTERVCSIDTTASGGNAALLQQL